MGIIRRGFSFILGTVCGVYIAQNYNVPKIKDLANSYFAKAKQIEETYRKPSSKSREDDLSD